MNKKNVYDERMIHRLIVLSGLFFAALLIANVVSAKLFSIGDIVITAGIITYPLTFLLVDSITEVYGKKIAQKVVIVGLFANILMIMFFYIAIKLPSANYWTMQTEFASVLGTVPRMVIASLAAYAVSQLLDIYLFHKIREMTKGKHLWLRNNASTLTSQLLDSIIFLTVAFIGTVPFPTLAAMIGTQYFVKLVITILDTPLIYLVVKWLRSGQTEDMKNKEAIVHV